MNSDNKPDLEQDLESADWIVRRVQTDDVYAQNLYAALCSQAWQKNTTWSVLKNQIWTTSWRGAGGVVSRLRGTGEYMDWYCSGMFPEYDEQIQQGYVSEGTVSEQIAQDLADLGWVTVPYPELPKR